MSKWVWVGEAGWVGGREVEKRVKEGGGKRRVKRKREGLS